MADRDTLRARALYGIRQNVGYTVAIDNIRAYSADEAAWWTNFTKVARAAVENFTVNTSVPTGIPTSGHAFVVLGSALNSNGSMRTKLIRRLDLVVKAMKKYPNSKVIVSGGAAKSGVTEAAAMKKYLISAGISNSKIIVEDRSSSTVSNGRNSIDKLVANKLSSYTIVSDASHLRRSTLIFEAAKLRWQYKNNKSLNLKMVKNLGFPDENIGKAATTATRNTVFLYAAYTAYLTGKYETAVAKNEISYPILRVGSRGDWVKSLQSKLGITADGIFGPKTKAAVQKYQKSKKLVQDGIAGPLTLKALGVSAK